MAEKSEKLTIQSLVLPQHSDDQPIIIAGPCSAETEDQIMTTASALAQMGIKIFRAGIWKPRTRPNTFSGVGLKGLPWLRRVRQELGMLTTIEVASAQHVYEALKFGVDILWIGARTTANPFLVQEIADALRGVDVPVMVKNPINPDLNLWIGAIERIYNAGVKQIAAIHRGFSVYGKSIYRNVPQWQIPIDLKAHFPQITLINDPSHISGRRDLIQSVSQKAMDLGFDGLMIEVHHDPDNAWSDAKQQITPLQLQDLLQSLKTRHDLPHSEKLENKLETLRADIDSLDSLLMEIISERMRIVQKIGEIKHKHNITIFQKDRWRQIIRRNKDLARRHGLSEEFVQKIFKEIHEESVKLQTDGLGKDFLVQSQHVE